MLPDKSQHWPTGSSHASCRSNKRALRSVACEGNHYATFRPSIIAVKIKKIASIAEIVSAVAVVISLLYVGYEVRQNTAAVKSSAYQSIHDAEDLYWSSISGDAELSALWKAGLDGGFQALSPNQQPQFSITTRRLIYLFQNVHYQRRKGVVDDELWSAWVASLDEFLAMKGFIDVLTTTRPHLSKPFVKMLDSRQSLDDDHVNRGD